MNCTQQRTQTGAPDRGLASKVGHFLSLAMDKCLEFGPRAEDKVLLLQYASCINATRCASYGNTAREGKWTQPTDGFNGREDGRDPRFLRINNESYQAMIVKDEVRDYVPKPRPVAETEGEKGQGQGLEVLKGSTIRAPVTKLRMGLPRNALVATVKAKDVLTTNLGSPREGLTRPMDMVMSSPDSLLKGSIEVFDMDVDVDFGASLMGDEADRRMLAQMCEKDREEELCLRRVKREELQYKRGLSKNVDLKRKPGDLVRSIFESRPESPAKRKKSETRPIEVSIDHHDVHALPAISLSTDCNTNISGGNSIVESLIDSRPEIVGHEYSAQSSNISPDPETEVTSLTINKYTFLSLRVSPKSKHTEKAKEKEKEKEATVTKKTSPKDISRRKQQQMKQTTKDYLKMFPNNYERFVEAILGWDLKWQVDLDNPASLRSKEIRFLYPNLIEVVQQMTCFDFYFTFDQFMVSYIPGLLLEVIKFTRSCAESGSFAAMNTTTLLLKEFGELDLKPYLYEVKAEVLREGRKAKFSKGDLVSLDFSEKGSPTYLGLVNSVKSNEDTANKTMSGTVLHVIDEYTILVKANLRRKLRNLRSDDRGFEVAVLTNIESWLIKADAVYQLKGTSFSDEFLNPKPINGETEKITVRLDPRIATQRMSEAIELAIGFITDTKNIAKTNWSGDYHRSQKILCLTSENDPRKFQATQEIVKNAVRTKPSVRLLLITVQNKLQDWFNFMSVSKIKYYTVSRRFQPAKERLKSMDKVSRRELLDDEFFASSRKLPKRHVRAKILDEVDAWLEGKLDISPYTSLNLERYMDKKREKLFRNSTIAIGTYEEIVNDPTLRPLMKRYSLKFDCCLVDAADQMSEINVVSLIFHRINKLLLLGSNRPLSQGQKSLVERYISAEANLSF